MENGKQVQGLQAPDGSARGVPSQYLSLLSSSRLLAYDQAGDGFADRR